MLISRVRSPKGFTLIELLVVIAIIGILASIVLVSLNGARAKARDARRLSDLRSVEKALELYYASNDTYPTSCGGTTNAWKGHGSNFSDCNTDYIEGLTPYMAVLPIDPSGDSTQGYIYRVATSKQDYKFMSYIKMEQTTYPQGAPLSRCGAGCTPAYCTDANSLKTAAVYVTNTSACW